MEMKATYLSGIIAGLFVGMILFMAVIKLASIW